MYASHTDFEQTNVLPFTPPEGLLGVTDFLKRRVTLPFRGNFAEFRHTMRHELVHVFQMSIGVDRYNRSPRAAQIPIPLWLTEGLAEYWSGGEDARDEMILRDLVLSGRLPSIPRLTYVTGGIVYPLGGRICRWLSNNYGDWRFAALYRDLWRYENFEAAVLGIYGRSLQQLSEEFELSMRRAYYPVAEQREPLTVSGRLVAAQAIKPAVIEEADGDAQILYASPADGYETIYQRSLDQPKEKHTLLVGGKSSALEAFHPFDSRIDPSRPGLLLLAAKRNERDALVIYDLAHRKIVGRYQFPSIVSILSPAWLPNSSDIVFSGLAVSGISDIYRVTLPEGTLQKVTDDRYQDLDPSPSPDGRRIVFASDRTAGGLDGAVNLFVYDLASGDIRQLTSGSWVDETPRWGADERIYFASDRDSVLNIFSVDTMGAGRRETSAWTGAFDVALIPGRDAFVVSGFNDLTLGVYYQPADSAARADSFPQPAEGLASGQWHWPTPDSASVAAVAGREPYHSKFALDFAAGQATFIPKYGAAQGFTFFLSDLLSDHQLIFNISSYQGRELGDLFGNINVLALYINQKRRINWGIGGFRTKGNNYQGDFTAVYSEKATGVFGLIRYPLSRFSRVEGQAVVEHSDRVDFVIPTDTPRRKGWVVSQFVSFVHDNALWMSSGPVAGSYFNLTAGVSNDFSNARFDSWQVSADARRYFRITRRSAYAIRAIGFYSGGDRPDRINIGGTLGLRGYPIYGYIVGTKAYMLNQELRFSLLDYLSFGTSAGEVRLPDFQAAVFVDVGKAWYDKASDQALLGSYGLGFRWAGIPGIVLRLDWGRRFSDHNFTGYGLSPDRRDRSFVQFFFGYNY